MSAKHVAYGKAAGVVACELRGLSHESLACLAANLIVRLEGICGCDLSTVRSDYNALLLERIADAEDYLTSIEVQS